MIFGRRLFKDFRKPYNGRLNREGIVLKIDRAPLQSDRFTSSQTIDNRQHNNVFNDGSLDCFQQRFGLFLRVETAHILVFLWQRYPVCGIIWDDILFNGILQSPPDHDVVVMQAFPGQLPLDMLSWFLCFAIIVQLQILGRNIIQGYVVLLEIRTDMVPVVAGISLKCDPVNLVLLLLQPCLKPLPE